MSFSKPQTFDDFYSQKREGGQYVRLIQQDFSSFVDSVENLVFALEACKRVKLSTAEQDGKVLEILSKSSQEYPNSAPTRKQKALVAEFKGRLIKGGVPENKTYSWSSFFQAYHSLLRSALNQIACLTPKAQPLHYSKGIFMVMSFEEALNYTIMRNNLCVMLARHIFKLFQKVDKGKITFNDFISMVASLDQSGLQNFSERVRKLVDDGLLPSTNNELGMGERLTLATAVEWIRSFKMDFKNAKKQDLLDPNVTDFASDTAVSKMILGSFPVDYLRVPLNVSWRKNKTIPKVENETFVTSCIYAVLGVCGFKYNGNGNYHNNKDPDFVNWHLCFKAIKRIAVTCRTETQGGRGANTANPIKDYDQYKTLDYESMNRRLQDLLLG